MPLHLVKLCVGIDSAEDLRVRISMRRELARAQSKTFQMMHTTRMVPKRAEELLDGGSLYWVIKGNIQARQKFLDIEEFKDPEGIKRCNLILDHKLVLTNYQPRRAFQGWRYLKPEDAPEDLNAKASSNELDPKMRADLMELCLI